MGPVYAYKFHRKTKKHGKAKVAGIALVLLSHFKVCTCFHSRDR